MVFHLHNTNTYSSTLMVFHLPNTNTYSTTLKVFHLHNTNDTNNTTLKVFHLHNTNTYSTTLKLFHLHNTNRYSTTLKMYHLHNTNNTYSTTLNVFHLHNTNTYSTILNKQLVIILKYQNSITALLWSCFAFSLTASPANGPLVYQACKTSLIHKTTYTPRTSHPHSDRYIPHTVFCVMLQMWSPLTR